MRDDDDLVPGFELGQDDLSDRRDVVVDANETAVDVWIGCVAW